MTLAGGKEGMVVGVSFSLVRGKLVSYSPSTGEIAQEEKMTLRSTETTLCFGQ